MLSVIIPRVIMLSIVILSAFMLSFIVPCINTLNVVMLNIVVLSVVAPIIRLPCLQLWIIPWSSRCCADVVCFSGI